MKSLFSQMDNLRMLKKTIAALKQNKLRADASNKIVKLVKEALKKTVSPTTKDLL